MKLYHISSDVRRKRFRMVPRVPSTCMAGEESTIPRICVGPSIAACIRGIRGLHPNEVPHVKYKPIRAASATRYGVYMVEAEPMPPMGVPDAEKTGELWLTTTHTFDKLGEIIVDYDVDFSRALPTKVNFAWEWAIKL